MVAHFTPDKPVVSADWLKSHLSAPDIRVLDCSWFMPDGPRTGRQAYDAHHIPGARYFDIDDIADTTLNLPHMLPPPEKFSSRVRRLGLGDGHAVALLGSGNLGRVQPQILGHCTGLGRKSFVQFKQIDVSRFPACTLQRFA